MESQQDARRPTTRRRSIRTCRSSGSRGSPSCSRGIRPARRRRRARSTTSRSTSIAASTSRSPDRRAAASRRCCRSSALLDAPSSGRYWFNGRRVDQLSPGEKARMRNVDVGLIFQSFNLIGDMTVYENVEYPLTLHGVAGADRTARVDAALARVGLDGARQAAPRVAVGRPPAARRDRARDCRPSADRARRRADRQPRLEERRGGDADARGAARRRRRRSASPPTIRATSPAPRAASTSSTAGSCPNRSPPDRASRLAPRASNPAPRSLRIAFQ